MPANTTRGDFRYPVEADNSRNVRTDLQNLAQDIDGKVALLVESTAATRPTAGVFGRFHRATDTGALSLDTGTDWVIVPTALVGQAYDSARLGGVSAALYYTIAQANEAYARMGLALTGAGQSIPNATVTAVSFANEERDDYGAVTVPITSLTIPAGKGGWKHVDATALFGASASGHRQIRLMRNGVAIAQHNVGPDVAGSVPERPAVSGDWLLADGDVVRVDVFQDSGGALSLSPRLSIHNV